MSRYKAQGPWSVDKDLGWGVIIESADALDTRTGIVYGEGAMRVRVNGKAPRGKGGTVPFYGETAWSDAQRLAEDLRLVEMNERRY
jgi:hypothetical protein